VLQYSSFKFSNTDGVKQMGITIAEMWQADGSVPHYQGLSENTQNINLSGAKITQ